MNSLLEIIEIGDTCLAWDSSPSKSFVGTYMGRSGGLYRVKITTIMQGEVIAEFHHISILSPHKNAQEMTA